MPIPVGGLALAWNLQRVSGCVYAMFFGRGRDGDCNRRCCGGAMRRRIVGFSLRRRMDKHAQEESDPELRQAYIDAQRQMDRGRASSHGFFS